MYIDISNVDIWTVGDKERPKLYIVCTKKASIGTIIFILPTFDIEPNSFKSKNKNNLSLTFR